MSEQVDVVEKVQRIVELETGEKANFGARANLLTSFDTESGVITFKVITGEVIVWDAASIVGLEFASLNELGKTVVLYGLLAKVKTNLAAVKPQEEVKDAEGNVVVVNSLADTIKSQIESISAGKFTVRGGSDDAIELSIDQKAFAKAAVSEPKFADALSLDADEVAGWTDLSAEATINAVTALWDSYDASTRNAIRRNAYHKLQKALLEIEAAK